MHHDVAAGSTQDEIAVSVQARAGDPVIVHGDRAWVSSRRDHEVVFKLALVAVIDEVDAGIDVVELDFRIRWNVRAPQRGVGPEKVVDLTWKRVDALCRRGRLAADQAHRNAVEVGCADCWRLKDASLPDSAS